MKVGIITFQRENNYGAILQCYALYTVLKKYNQDTQVIDYRNPYLENQYAIFPKKSNLILQIASFCKSCFYYKSRKKRNANFNKFRNNIDLSNSLTKEEICKGALTNYDIIVSGSDQVWNPHITGGFDAVYLQTFPFYGSRISYAVSLGNTKDTVYQNSFFQQAVSNFKCVSLRETDDNISRILHKSVLQHLDPTLLLSKEEWMSVIGNAYISGLPKKYIFLYSVQESTGLIQMAIEISNHFNIPIVCFNKPLKIKKEFLCIEDAGPIEFLYVLEKSKIVVTSSFHGTAFASIFRKELYVMLPSHSSSRLDNLISLLNIEDRRYTSIKNFYEDKNRYKEICYSYSKLEESKAVSIDYIMSFLGVH